MEEGEWEGEWGSYDDDRLELLLFFVIIVGGGKVCGHFVYIGMVKYMESVDINFLGLWAFFFRKSGPLSDHLDMCQV